MCLAYVITFPSAFRVAIVPSSPLIGVANSKAKDNYDK